MEKWFVYILFSEKIDKYYVGYTANLDLRVQRHNEGSCNPSPQTISCRLPQHSAASRNGRCLMENGKWEKLFKNILTQKTKSYMTIL